MATYLAKVTGAGQITLPKGIRDKLSLSDGSYIEITTIGDAVVARKLRADLNLLETVRKKIRRSGITRSRAMRIVEESSGEVWTDRRG